MIELCTDAVVLEEMDVAAGSWLKAVSAEREGRK